MKRESREQIIAAYETTSAALGLRDLSGGLRYMCNELEKSLRLLRRAKNRTGLEVALTKEPEPSPEQLDAMVTTIKLLPYQVRKALPKATKEAVKHLPHEPGGRPRAFNPDERAKVCKEIGQMFADGVALKDAQKRVAQRNGVSLRTIQRVWQKRKQPAAKVISASNKEAARSSPLDLSGNGTP